MCMRNFVSLESTKFSFLPLCFFILHGKTMFLSLGNGMRLNKVMHNGNRTMLCPAYTSVMEICPLLCLSLRNSCRQWRGRRGKSITRVNYVNEEIRIHKPLIPMGKTTLLATESDIGSVTKYLNISIFNSI